MILRVSRPVSILFTRLEVEGEGVFAPCSQTERRSSALSLARVARPFAASMSLDLRPQQTFVTILKDILQGHELSLNEVSQEAESSVSAPKPTPSPGSLTLSASHAFVRRVCRPPGDGDHQLYERVQDKFPFFEPSEPGWKVSASIQQRRRHVRDRPPPPSPILALQLTSYGRWLPP